jgi:glycerol-3-phosphate cytidylyltransferase
MPAEPAAEIFTAHALAIGVFDLFHVGHLRYLQYVRARCRRMTVLVAGDRLVMQRKNRRPVCSEDARLEIIRGLGWVDAALLLRESIENLDGTLQFLAPLGLSHAFFGAEWQAAERWQRLIAGLQAQGIEVSFVPRQASISTTALRRQIAGEHPGT